MAKTVYMSDGPTLDGAIIMSGNSPAQAHSSQTTSLSGPGIGSGSPEQSLLENAMVGSIPVVNTLTVSTNQDGTIGVHTSVADAMPETSPGTSSRNGTAAASTGSISSVGVQTGWVPVGNGYKYFKEDGSGYKIGWHFDYNADGNKRWYYLDDAPNHKEYMVTGWKKIVRGDGILSWYHFRVDGKMSRYWEYLKERWYYFEPTDDAGYMITDWIMINDNWYYFLLGDSDGNMMIGWHEIRGKWYYFYDTDEKRGIMAHDYLMRHTDGNLYFLQEKNDGSMAVNKPIRDPATGIDYYADEYGVCREGTGNDVFSNLANNTSLNLSDNMKKTMVGIGRTMLGEGYELAFIAGLLANINHEGKSAGYFESSNYKSKPSEEPDYLLYMDKNYAYRSKYSGQNIVDKSLSELARILNQLDPKKRQGFGLGSVQWTFGRTKTLVSIYQEKAGSSDTITFDQTIVAEGLMISREFSGYYNEDYINVNPNWKKANSNSLTSEEAANSAGVIICKQYEKPKEDSSKTRGKTAKELYKILLGK